MESHAGGRRDVEAMPADDELGFHGFAPVAAFALVFIAACIVVGFVIQPISSGPVAGDAAASVLYWDRIVSGQRLEAFVNTTPKPLLTVVYGIAWSLTEDWRAISVLAIGAAAACASLAAALAFRIAGPVAAVLAALAIVIDGRMLAEVSWAYGLPWALAFLAAAGLALTANPRRHGLAGLMLMLGCLVRPETFLVVGVGTVVLGWALLQRRVPGRAALFLVAWLALPVMLLHDLLLAGDPMYWLRVSGVYAEGLRTQPASAVVRRLFEILVDNPVLSVGATIGILAALRARRGRLTAIAIVALGAGTAALSVVVALGHRQVLGHYYNPIWSALGFAAALGVGFVVNAAARRLSAWPRAGRIAAQLTLGIVFGALVLWPIAATPGALQAIADQRRIAVDADAAAAQLRDRAGTLDLSQPPVGPLERPSGGSLQLLVPRATMYRLAVDLGLPLTVLGPLVADRPTPGLVHPGVLAFHDEVADPKTPLTEALGGPSPVTINGVTFDLVTNDPRGVWIWQAR